MAISLNSISYPPNSRPGSPAAGLLSGAPAAVRIGQMRQNASLRLSTAAMKAGTFAAPAGGTINPTFGSILREVVSPFGLLKTAGISALLSFPLAAVANFMDLKQGNLTQKQFLVNTVADGCAYTVSGTLASLAGAVIGSLIPIPFVGTMIGMAGGLALGALLGKLYDEQVRPRFQEAVCKTMTQAGML